MSTTSHSYRPPVKADVSVDRDGIKSGTQVIENPRVPKDNPFNMLLHILHILHQFVSEHILFYCLSEGHHLLWRWLIAQLSDSFATLLRQGIGAEVATCSQIAGYKVVPTWFPLFFVWFSNVSIAQGPDHIGNSFLSKYSFNGICNLLNVWKFFFQTIVALKKVNFTCIKVLFDWWNEYIFFYRQFWGKPTQFTLKGGSTTSKHVNREVESVEQ